MYNVSLIPYPNKGSVFKLQPQQWLTQTPTRFSYVSSFHLHRPFCLPISPESLAPRYSQTPLHGLLPCFSLSSQPISNIPNTPLIITFNQYYASCTTCIRRRLRNYQNCMQTHFFSRGNVPNAVIQKQLQ